MVMLYAARRPKPARSAYTEPNVPPVTGCGQRSPRTSPNMTDDGGVASWVADHPAAVVLYAPVATSPGTPSRISKDAFVETGDPGVVT